MKLIKIISIITIYCIVFQGCATIPVGRVERVTEPLAKYGRVMEKEGPFVDFPGNVGGVVFAPTLLLTMPFWLLCKESESTTSEEEKKDETLKRSLDRFFSVPFAGVHLGYNIFATPFYVVKKVFWDFPESIRLKNMKYK